MNGTVPSSILVGVRYIAACLVVALGVMVGAVLVGVVACTAPEAVLQSRALEVLVVRVELLALAAANGVRDGVAVGAVSWGGFVVKLRHVDNAYVVLQAQLSGNVQSDVGVWWGVRGLVMGVLDKGGTCEVRVEVLHDAAIVEVVFDLLMADGPELFLVFELNFV